MVRPNFAQEDSCTYTTDSPVLRSPAGSDGGPIPQGTARCRAIPSTYCTPPCLGQTRCRRLGRPPYPIPLGEALSHTHRAPEELKLGRGTSLASASASALATRGSCLCPRRLTHARSQCPIILRNPGGSDERSHRAPHDAKPSLTHVLRHPLSGKAMCTTHIA